MASHGPGADQLRFRRCGMNQTRVRGKYMSCHRRTGYPETCERHQENGHTPGIEAQRSTPVPPSDISSWIELHGECAIRVYCSPGMVVCSAAHAVFAMSATLTSGGGIEFESVQRISSVRWLVPKSSGPAPQWCRIPSLADRGRRDRVPVSHVPSLGCHVMVIWVAQPEAQPNLLPT